MMNEPHGYTPELEDRIRRHVQSWIDDGKPGECSEYVARKHAAECAIPVWVLTAACSALIQWIVTKILEKQFGNERETTTADAASASAGTASAD